jgi:hypothetical protein
MGGFIGLCGQDGDFGRRTASPSFPSLLSTKYKKAEVT